MPVPTRDSASSSSSAVDSGESETTSCAVGHARSSSRLRQYLPLVVLSAAAGLDTGGVSILNGALPSIGAQFAMSAQSLSWAVSGYALTFAGLLLCGGALADRLQRRQVLVWGLAMLAAGGVLAFIAPAFWVVVAGRVLQGMGAAITMPAATALLTSVYPNDPMRSRALGVFSSAQAGCYAAGLVLGGVITTALSWRWAFALQVLVAVLTATAAIRWLPISTRPTHHQPIDRAGAGALVTAIILTVLAANMASQRYGLPLAAVLLAAAASAGYLWWRRSRADNHQAVLLDRTMLRLGSVRVAVVVACVFFFCVAGGSLFFLPLYLQQLRGMSAALSGLAILPVSIAVSISALLAGRLMKTRGPRTLLTLGIPLTALGVLLWCTADAHSPYLGAILAGLIITGIGQGLTFPALMATGLQDVPADAHGMASALIITALQIGSAIGPTVLAGIAQSTVATADAGLSLTGYHRAFAVAAAALVLIAVPVVTLLPKQPAA